MIGKNLATTRRLLARLSSLMSRRTVNTSSIKRGSAPGAHHDVVPQNKAGGLLDWIVVREHPKLHDGYLYREAGNLQGATNATIGKTAITIAWWFIFYHLFTSPELIFGHMEYPDTAKWTDEELGIPPDDQE